LKSKCRWRLEVKGLADEKAKEDSKPKDEPLPEAEEKSNTALPRPSWVPLPPDSYRYRVGNAEYAQIRPINIPLPKPGGGLKTALPRPDHIPLPPDSSKFQNTLASEAK
jgi:hypothetical protein